LDQAEQDRAYELFEAARLQKSFKNYSGEMLGRRVALLPNRSLIERIDAVGTLAMQSPSSNLRMRSLSNVIAAKAWSAAEAGDKKAFLKIREQGVGFLGELMRSTTGSLVDNLIILLFANEMAESFATGSEKIGLVPDAAQWRAISDRLDAKNQNRYEREFIVDGKIAVPERVTGAIFGNSLALVARQPEHQPELTDFDLMPGRLLDHEILSRFFAYVSWMLMGLCAAAVAVYRFRVSRLGRRLAGRMEELMNARDWAWFLGVGILLPFLYVMAVNRLTPLGGRQFGMLGTGMLLPAAHFLGLLMLWLTVPVQVARWRLAERAGTLGFTRTSWLGWAAVAGAVGFVPWIGWAGISLSYPEFWRGWMSEVVVDTPSATGGVLRFWLAIGFLGVPVLWVIYRVSYALVNQSQRLIQQATVARILVKAYGVAMLMLALASIGFKASESYWFAREKLGEIDPAKPGWSAFEYDVAVQMRKELREILDGGGS